MEVWRRMSEAVAVLYFGGDALRKEEGEERLGKLKRGKELVV